MSRKSKKKDSDIKDFKNLVMLCDQYEKKDKILKEIEEKIITKLLKIKNKNVKTKKDIIQVRNSLIDIHNNHIKNLRKKIK